MSFFDELFGPPNVEKLKAQGNVNGLIKALSYKKGKCTIDGGEHHIRKNAAEALGLIGDRQAVEPLIAVLKYDHPYDKDVCYNAIRALGAIGDSRAFDPLIAILNNTSYDKYARSAAISALMKLRDSQRLIQLIDIFLNFPQGQDGYDLKRSAYEELVKIGEPSVEPLINSLNLGNTYWASKTLGKIGDRRAIEPLISVLKNEKEGYSRLEIVSTLGKFRDRRATEALLDALNDTWYGGSSGNYGYGSIAILPVVGKAAWALGELGDSRAVEPLINTAIIKVADMDLRENASIALGKIGDSKTVELMMGYLKVEDKYVQESAALVLVELMKNIRDRRYVPQLIATLRSNKIEEVQKSIIIALGYIGDPIAVNPIIEIIEKGRIGFVLGASYEALERILGTAPGDMLMT